MPSAWPGDRPGRRLHVVHVRTGEVADTVLQRQIGERRTRRARRGCRRRRGNRSRSRNRCRHPGGEDPGGSGRLRDVRHAGARRPPRLPVGDRGGEAARAPRHQRHGDPRCAPGPARRRPRHPGRLHRRPAAVPLGVAIPRSHDPRGPAAAYPQRLQPAAHRLPPSNAPAPVEIARGRSGSGAGRGTGGHGNDRPDGYHGRFQRAGDRRLGHGNPHPRQPPQVATDLPAAPPRSFADALPLANPIERLLRDAPCDVALFSKAEGVG